LSTGRTFQTATILTSGKVLVAGGWARSGGLFVGLASAELYDPVLNTWSSAGNMSLPRADGHSATLLTSGEVLVAGGDARTDGNTVANADLYDPASNTWTAAGAMSAARYAHTATLLQDGRVLAAGGVNVDTNSWLASAEIYDPTSESWSTVGSLATARDGHTATLLGNGEVLAAGGQVGYTSTQRTLTATAEIYNPATNGWSAAGAL